MKASDPGEADVGAHGHGGENPKSTPQPRPTAPALKRSESDDDPLRLHAVGLSVDALALTLPRLAGDRERHLSLRASGGLTGALKQREGELDLDVERTAILDIDAFDWAFESFALRGDAGSLVNAKLELTYRAGRITRLLLNVESSTRMRVEVRTSLPDLETVTVVGQLAFTGARIEMSETDMTVVADRAHLRAAELRQGDVRLHVDSLELDDFRSRMQFEPVRGGLQGFFVTCREGLVRGARMAIGNVRADADALVLSRGFSVTPKGFECPVVDINRADVALRGLAERQERAGSDSLDQVETVDVGFLEALQAALEVRAEVDLKLPIVGRLRAARTLRPVIEDGTISYRRLERDLGRIVDAMVHVRRKDGWLEVVRDIPIVPFDLTVLARIPLGTRDLELAQQERVRLGTLARIQFPSDADKGREESSDDGIFRSVQLVCAESPFSVSGGTALRQRGLTVRLGGASNEEPAVARGTVRGSIRFRGGEAAPGSEADAARPTEIFVEATDLHAGVRLSPRDGWAGGCEHITVGALHPLIVGMTGVDMNTLDATLSNVRLTGATIDVPTLELERSS